MNRCNRLPARLIAALCFALAGLSLTLAPGAHAQGMQRSAPKDVVLGRMTVTAPPQVTLDGKPDRLSPASRIRDPHVVRPASLSHAGPRSGPR